MTTEAGRALLDDLDGILDLAYDQWNDSKARAYVEERQERMASSVAAIEAEARAALLAELEALREAAQAVVDSWVDDESGMETFDPEVIDRLAAVLDLIQQVTSK